MLLGHFGIGFAGKTLTKEMPLWVLFIAVMIPDLMSLVFSLAGISDEGAFLSHSLLMTLVFAAFSAVVIFLVFRCLFDVLLFCGLIFTHWICDWIAWPMEAIDQYHGISLFVPEKTFGLGLYKTMAGALLCEFLLFFAGMGLYLYSRRRARNNEDNPAVK